MERGVFRGGYGDYVPPGPVKSIYFRGFYRYQQVLSPPPLERKKIKPPWTNS